jgi:hypothetical protein
MEDDVLLRLAKVERQNARLKRFGFLLLFVFGAVFWMGQARAARNLEAGKIVLKDAKARKRAELGVFQDGPALIFYDESGGPLVSVGGEEDGPGLTIWGAKRRKLAVFSDTGNGPVLSLLDGSGRKRLNLSMLGGQGPTLGILGPTGQAKAALGMMGSDNAFLHLFGAGEHGGAQFSATKDSAVVRFFDANDKPRAVLGLLEKENAPGLALNDLSGASRVLLMLTQGGPSLDFLDQNRGVTWRAP